MTTRVYRDIVPESLPLPERYQTLLAGVAPRPIAFVSTLDEHGGSNLSPYSFFTAFGSAPPCVGFSAALFGRSARQKDTLRNVLATREFTVSVVTRSMAEQMNLTSFEFASGVDEFEVGGFGKLPSLKVKPPGVAESPYVLECSFLQHVPLGNETGSGNLIIGQVVLFRVLQEMYDDRGRIDPARLDQVGRLGASWYTRARDGLFALRRPDEAPMGIASLPPGIRTSPVLTGRDLALLAAPRERPSTSDLLPELRERYGGLSTEDAHRRIHAFLEAGQIREAWALVEIAERLE